MWRWFWVWSCYDTGLFSGGCQYTGLGLKPKPLILEFPCKPSPLLSRPIKRCLLVCQISQHSASEGLRLQQLHRISFRSHASAMFRPTPRQTLLRCGHEFGCLYTFLVWIWGQSSPQFFLDQASHRFFVFSPIRWELNPNCYSGSLHPQGVFVALPT